MAEPQEAIRQLESSIRALTERVAALETKIGQQQSTLAKVEELASWIGSRKPAFERWAELDQRSKNP